jgi:hypothetical protein
LLANSAVASGQLKAQLKSAVAGEQPETSLNNYGKQKKARHTKKELSLLQAE